MYKPQKSEAEQQAFFNNSYDKFLQAKTSAGEINFYYRIANTTVCLKFAGNELVPYLTPALEHLRMNDDCVPDFTICIWDSDSTHVEMVPPPCTKDCFTDRGDIWGFNSRRIKAAFHWIECSVNLIDLEEKTGIYWVQTAETLPYWVLASPLRTIFHWWMENNGCQLLHAAAVGTEKGAVLITGKGGVGKSTTALTCLQRGFFYLADDYVIVKIEPTPTVVSLYSTAKLNADHVSNFPDLSRFMNNPEKLDQEKAVIFLNPYLSKKLVFEITLKVILTPQIIDCRSSTIAPVSKWELQHAMSFTSMSQLPYMGRYAYDYIDRLIKEVPHYRLLIGSDFASIPIVVSDLLNDTNSGRLTCHETSNDQVGLEEKPLISVIIPVFNGERFIREAVQNVISQNYPALEIIIVNDGSYDGTEDIIKQLSVDLRYFSQPNSGPAAARNRGICNASGDFIAFLDVDDLWPENNLHSMMEEMLQYPELSVVRGYGQMMEYDAEVNIYNFIGGPKDSFFNFIGAGLYRKAVFEKVGLFDPTLRFAEDSDWYIRAAELGIKMKRLEETRLYVRRHGRNMTEGKNIVELNTLKLFKKLIDRKRMPQS